MNYLENRAVKQASSLIASRGYSGAVDFQRRVIETTSDVAKMMDMEEDIPKILEYRQMIMTAIRSSKT